MQLTFDADVEAFRADFVAFLDEHLPSEADARKAKEILFTGRGSVSGLKRSGGSID